LLNFLIFATLILWEFCFKNRNFGQNSKFSSKSSSFQYGVNSKFSIAEFPYFSTLIKKNGVILRKKYFLWKTVLRRIYTSLSNGYETYECTKVEFMIAAQRISQLTPLEVEILFTMADLHQPRGLLTRVLNKNKKNLSFFFNILRFFL